MGGDYDSGKVHCFELSYVRGLVTTTQMVTCSVWAHDDMVTYHHLCSCDKTPRIGQLKAVHRSWIVVTPSKTRGMDSPATPVGLSPPLLSLALRNEPCYTKCPAVAHSGLWLARLMFHNRNS